MRAFAAMRVRMFVALARAGFTDVRAQPANIARPCTAPRDRAGCESAHQRAIDIEPHTGGEARRIGLPKARDRTLVACSRARIACAHARFISFVHRPLPAVRHRDRRAQSACPPPCFGDTASATRLRYRFNTVRTPRAPHDRNRSRPRAARMRRGSRTPATRRLKNDLLKSPLPRLSSKRRRSRLPRAARVSTDLSRPGKRTGTSADAAGAFARLRSRRTRP